MEKDRFPQLIIMKDHYNIKLNIGARMRLNGKLKWNIRENSISKWYNFKFQSGTYYPVLQAQSQMFGTV